MNRGRNTMMLVHHAHNHNNRRESHKDEGLGGKGIGSSPTGVTRSQDFSGSKKKLSGAQLGATDGEGERSVHPKDLHKIRPSVSNNDMAHGAHAHNQHQHHDPSTLGEAPEIILEDFDVSIWETDEDLVAMRSHMNELIRSAFGGGMQYFIDGDWKMAIAKFNHVLNITAGRDGPSINILRHINDDYGGECPADWKGYRDMS